MGEDRVSSAERPEPNLVQLVREDWIANYRNLAQPGFQAVVVYRFGSWSLRAAPGHNPIVRKSCTLLYRCAATFVRNFYGIELPRECQVGRRLRIAHQHGIVVSGQAQLGDDCVLRQNVTIGQHVVSGAAPILGDRVDIGAGAVLVGPIRVGDDVRIGPNSVVTTNVASGATVFAQPSRVISTVRPTDASRASVNP
jgi:serine O-acetyltransferase